MPKISDPVYPSQTGAQVANGDLMYIVDVGTPNISEKITVNELAQAPQFSSRYMAISSGIEFAWANDMRSTRGSVALSELSTTESAYTVMLYDSASSESAVMYCKVPDGATTVAVDIYWTNAGAGSGNVRWSLEQVKGLIDGGTTISDLASAPRLVTATAPATDTVEVTELANNYTVTTGARLVRLTITRYGGDGADTLGNDAALIAVALRGV